MFASIFLPMIMGSVHLLNSGDYNLNGFGKFQKFLNAVRFFLLSPLQPVILDAIQHQNMEKARKWAQHYNNQAIKMTRTKMKVCRILKKQLVTFIKIELGIEVYVQITVQLLILLLFKTETPTTAGLTTIFDQTAFGKKEEFKENVKQIVMEGDLPDTTNDDADNCQLVGDGENDDDKDDENQLPHAQDILNNI